MSRQTSQKERGKMDLIITISDKPTKEESDILLTDLVEIVDCNYTVINTVVKEIPRDCSKECCSCED